MNTPLFLIVLMVTMAGNMALEPGTHNMTLNDTSTMEIGLKGPGLGLIIASIVGALFCLAFVWNRIYWRLRLSGGLGYDDWAIIIALVRHSRWIADRSNG